MARRRWNAVSLLWLGLALYLAGRVVDLVWHATHPEFETAADQVQAHFVVWIGVLAMLVAAAWALGSRRSGPGFVIVLVGAMLDVGVSVWHFLEHARGTDPDLPHVLLGLAGVLLVVGAAWVGLDRWMASRRAGA